MAVIFAAPESISLNWLIDFIFIESSIISKRTSISR